MCWNLKPCQKLLNSVSWHLFERIALICKILWSVFLYTPLSICKYLSLITPSRHLWSLQYMYGICIVIAGSVQIYFTEQFWSFEWGLSEQPIMPGVYCVCYWGSQVQWAFCRLTCLLYHFKQRCSLQVKWCLSEMQCNNKRKYLSLIG